MSEQITTAEELDALPVGSVGRGELGQTYARYEAGWFGAGRKHPLDVSTEVAYPVTVLYRPDAPAPLVEDREALACIIFGGLRHRRGHTHAEVAESIADEILAWFAARSSQPAPSVSAAHALAKMTALSGGDAQAIVAAATALTTPSVDAEQALLRIKRFAEASAVTERARGRAEEERSWLDVLAIIEHAEVTP